MSFSQLKLSDPILKAVTEAGYTAPTTIQKQAIPIILSGRDLVAAAQTGTGKTASFVLPILEMFNIERKLRGKRNQRSFLHLLVNWPFRLRQMWLNTVSI